MSSIKAINNISNAVSPKISKTAEKMANGLSKFKGEDALLPIVLIEGCVTGGRTYQSYKRGGLTEARERFVEQGVSAVVWLFGVKVLNKIADKIGGMFLNKKYIETDVAKDALRNPFKNIVKDNQVKMAAFKFGKLAVSTTLATAFIGFILPKMIKKMTKKHLDEGKNSNNAPKEQGAKQTQNAAPIKENNVNQKNTDNKMSIDNFIKSTKTADNKDGLSFKGGEQVVNTLLNITNKLENDTRYRLMSTDVGIITGRTLNARNKYEAREFLFRDTASIYFYLFCAPHVFKGLSKLSGNVDIHPKAAIALANMLIKNPEALKELSKNMSETPANVDKLFKHAKDDVIPFEAFKKMYGKDKTLLAKAEKMANLQPVFDGKRYLSKQQVQDILSHKVTSDPDFLYETFDQVTKGKFAKPNKFVSKKGLEKVRKSLDDFTNSLIEYAKRKNLELNPDTINKFLKRNLALNTLFTLAGIAVSGTALAVIIPKIQNFMTKKATGSDKFPGVEEYNKK